MISTAGKIISVNTNLLLIQLWFIVSLLPHANMYLWNSWIYCQWRGVDILAASFISNFDVFLVKGPFPCSRGTLINISWDACHRLNTSSELLNKAVLEPLSSPAVKVRPQGASSPNIDKEKFDSLFFTPPLLFSSQGLNILLMEHLLVINN